MDRTLFYIFLSLCAFVAILVGLAFWAEQTGCEHRWRDHYDSWGPLMGCLVKLDNGDVVPEEVYKNVKLQK